MKFLSDFFGKAESYTIVALAVLVLTLGTYAWHLSNANTKLTTQVSTIAEQLESSALAAKTCSNNTDALVKAEQERTKRAQEAIDQAKKDSESLRKRADKIRRRPATQLKVPEPDATNAPFFGGNDPSVRMDDYLKTQQLFNDFIEQEPNQQMKPAGVPK